MSSIERLPARPGAGPAWRQVEMRSLLQNAGPDLIGTQPAVIINSGSPEVYRIMHQTSFSFVFFMVFPERISKTTTRMIKAAIIK